MSTHTNEAPEIFSDDDIAELQALLDAEGQPKWVTGDWLVARIESVPGHTFRRGESNGRDTAIRELARKTDSSDQTLRDRYLTSAAFPADKRHDDISWTTHRLFVTHGQPEASERLEKWLAAKPPKATKRAAAEWLAKETGKPIGEGSSSGSDIARSIERNADPEAKVKEIVRNLGTKGREAMAEAVAADEQISAKAAASAIKTERGRKAIAEEMVKEPAAKKAFFVAEQEEHEASSAHSNARRTESERVAAEEAEAEAAISSGEMKITGLLPLAHAALEVEGFLGEAEKVGYRVEPKAKDHLRKMAERFRNFATILDEIADGKVVTTITDEDLEALLQG